jgi:hypothetical protein
MACDLQPAEALAQELSSFPVTQPELAFTYRDHVGSLTGPELLFFRYIFRTVSADGCKLLDL